jgi:hypothetical protein
MHAHTVELLMHLLISADGDRRPSVCAPLCFGM